MNQGVQLARRVLVVFGVLLVGVAFLTLNDKPFPWRNALIFAGGSVFCFSLVRATHLSRRQGHGDGGRGGASAGMPVSPASPVLVGSAAESFPSERE